MLKQKSTSKMQHTEKINKMKETDMLAWATGRLFEAKNPKKMISIIVRELESTIKLAKAMEMKLQKDIAPGDKFDLFDQMLDSGNRATEDMRKLEKLL